MADLPAIHRGASRRAMLGGAAGLALAGLVGCGREEARKVDAPPAPQGPPEGSLEWAIAGSWRSAQDKARDAARHPMETLRFFGLQPRMTVVEFWPGSGWYTEILAPYLAHGAGTFIGALFPEGPTADPAQAALNAAFRTRFSSDRRLFGEPQFSIFGAASGPVAPPGTADMALFLRTLHGWMAAGIAEKAFADAYAALKPGGVLGVEQHRLGQARRVREGEPGGPPFGPDRDEPAVAEAGQVLAHGGLRQVHVVDEVTHAVLAARQVLKQREPHGLGECVEERGRAPSSVESCRLTIHRHMAMLATVSDAVEGRPTPDRPVPARGRWARTT